MLATGAYQSNRSLTADGSYLGSAFFPPLRRGASNESEIIYLPVGGFATEGLPGGIYFAGSERVAEGAGSEMG